jgi:putative DNA methylase
MLLSAGQLVNGGVGVIAAADCWRLPDKPSIAVLPFQNMSGDPEQEYFAFGRSRISLHDPTISFRSVFTVFNGPKKNHYTRISKKPFLQALLSDFIRERLVERIVSESLADWQARGFVAEMEIETGKENEGPIRTNGWKYWHQMFMPRAIFTASMIAKYGANVPEMALSISRYLDNNSESRCWKVSQSGGDGGAVSTFDSQALRTIFNWACRSSRVTPWRLETNDRRGIIGECNLQCVPAHKWAEDTDLFVTDPPYADSIRYEEITEFFIAWLRKCPPAPFDRWTWGSQRDLAIKGKDEDFRRAMVAAYASMTRHMPDNGLQVVMFTHQDAGVWADLGAILWAAGLCVSAAWNIVTETERPEGG